MILFKQRVTAPARLAGDIVLVHETITNGGSRRPALDVHPGPAAGAARPRHRLRQPRHHLRRAADRGPVRHVQRRGDRYDWKLVGKREMYVPYNSYRAHQRGSRLQRHHPAAARHPEHMRYELHRVWVVDATVKQGASHLTSGGPSTREDSWQILLADIYDNRDQLGGYPKATSSTSREAC